MDRLTQLVQRVAELDAASADTAAELVTAVSKEVVKQRLCAGAALLGEAGLAAVRTLATVAPLQAAAWLDLLPPLVTPVTDAAAWWTLLRGDAGLRATRWPARAAAARLVAALALASPSALPPSLAAETLLVTVGQADAKREVRVAALLAGASLLQHAELASQPGLLLALLAGTGVGDADVEAAVRRALGHAPPAFADSLRASLVVAAQPGSSASLSALLTALRALLELGGFLLIDSALLDSLVALQPAVSREGCNDALTGALGAASCFAPDSYLAWLTTCQSDAALRAAAVVSAVKGSGEAMLAATQVLLNDLQPPRSVFGADLLQPDAMAAFAESAALRFTVLQRLLAQLPDGAFPNTLRRDPEAVWAAASSPGEQALPGASALLVALSFACGGSLASDAGAGQGLPPWSSPSAASAAEALLAEFAPLGSREIMLCASLAARAPSLRVALVVPDLGAPYSPATPTAHEATVAAQTLRAALSRIGHPAASSILPAVMPLLLLALEHPSSTARSHAQRCLSHLLSTATRTVVRHYGDVLWPAAMSGLPGCDTALRPPAVAAISALADVLAGGEPEARMSHLLLAALLDDGVSHPGELRRLLPTLHAAPGLLRTMRLEALRHTLHLVPLLAETLECGAGAEAGCEAREAAALALTTLLEHCWPRAPHHALRLWPAVLQGYRRSSSGSPGQVTRAALERVAQQLLAAGGEPSTAALRAALQEPLASAPELAGLLRLLPPDCLPAPQQPEDEAFSVANLLEALSPVADEEVEEGLSEPEADAELSAWLEQLATNGQSCS